MAAASSIGPIVAAKFRASIFGSGDSPPSDVASRWLFDELLPFWCDTGFDRETGHSSNILPSMVAYPHSISSE